MNGTPDISQQIRERLNDFEVSPPEGLWDDISRQLPDNRPRPLIVRMRRWGIAASVLVALSVGTGYLLHRSPQETQVASVPSAAVETKEAPESQPIEPDAPSAVPSVSVPARRLTARMESVEEQGMVEEPVSETPEITAADEPKETPHVAEKPAPKPAQKPQQPAPEQPSAPTYWPRRTRVEAPVSLSLYAANGVTQQNQMNGVRMSDVAASKYFGDDYFSNSEFAKPNAVYLADITEEEHHYQPLSIGLSVGYSLTERLSLSAGVVYTWQRSDILRHLSDETITTRQKLQYVGVPVHVNYEFFAKGNFHAYAAAGGQIDANVKSSRKTDLQQLSIGHDRLQFSVDATVGVQYNFTPQLSLYAEPGLKYYFDNHSAINNYFKEHPASFNIQAGLRWTVGER